MVATVEELLNKAHAKNKNKKPNESPIKTPAKVEVISEKAGAIADIAKFTFRRDDNDSPTALFSKESIEQTALQSVSRLMNLWNSEISERVSRFVTPEDYVKNVNEIFSSYQGIRFRIDSTVAFLIGDILNECKTRFFNDEKKIGKKWLDFLKENISFSQRQAYDFMSISSKLSYARGKKLTMEQFRALLTLHSAGFDIHRLPHDLELMSPSHIVNLKNQNVLEEGEEAKKISRKQAMSTMLPVVTKLEKMMKEYDSLPLLSMESQTQKEKDHILSLKLKLESILSLINKNIF